MADPDAKFSATKTLQTELRLANEMVTTLRGYLRVSNERAERAEERLCAALALADPASGPADQEGER